MSPFLLTGFASNPSHDLPPYSQTIARAGGLRGVTSKKAGRLAARSIPVATSSVAVAAKPPPSPTIDWASFSQRLDASRDEHLIATDVLSPDSGRAGLPGEAAGSANARRERTVHSPISAFSFDQWPVPAVIDPPTEANVDPGRSPAPPRPDLLSGIPQEYAKFALASAAAEEVDPNWVLSIMRAENANFDPRLVSPAGAVGLMQVMPRIGGAFGANDLTDPEQNMRAGTRFLRVLIDKYRNPVLVASAYNAGEPRVDLRHSLPLIRETADYVTRVVGFYVGAAATPTGTRSLSSSSESGSKRRAGTADRAKSPMLVFSVADPLTAASRSPQEDGPTHVGGPVKIVKEEVH
ncbi:lytic transglycosylase domain-containing protein [Neorhizobium galegae]|uniref:lytic transglycosylase domain-containing protein n=1 Tax=Neorhizobium galegae TaxID=399 RepID=UPI0021036BE0|nr:transglycosylase SLT domain-containing protein [Neorhizobium galegae]MCQ1855020.1 transglycosylase SLT domain-containing protein [Neorhizobium galegae]